MLDQTLLSQIVLDVCDTMLGLGLEPTDCTCCDPPELVASIRIRGDVESLVEVAATMGMAQHVAAAMFAMDFDHVSSDELRDALGEVVNMIGGNIKGTLGGEADLSLPCVGAPGVARDESPFPVKTTVTMTRAGEFMSVRVHGPALSTVPA